MKIIIIGAGIGGLSTALLLKKNGHDVRVFESVKEIKPLGVGINILPHCVRVLTNLGLQEIISKNAIETSDLNYYNKFGQEFWTEPRGRFAGYKWPQFSIHRGKLQMIFLEEAIQKIGKENILLNHHLDNFQQDGDQVTANFIDKDSGEIVYSETADLLIGADGINSVVRKQLYPNEGPPIYSENVLYRGAAKIPHFLNGSTMAMIGSLRQKMVAYPIEPQADSDGNYLINWVANVKTGKSDLKARDWNRESDKNKLIELYKNWRFDWFDVLGMIEKTEKVYEFPMSDRDPLTKWTFGRVTLLGDAAHPMYPIGSNGASQAILDADSLAIHIENQMDESALVAYEQERLPATSKVVLQNRAKGPDEIMDLMEDWFPSGFSKEEIPNDKLKAIMDNYKQIAGFDIKTLNAKA
jgi:2-polyprenyl-6-methoxyphenol hydroxylase-like FAD-dependent oxidoreductase